MWFVDAKFQTRVAHWFDGRGARKSVCGRAWASGSDPTTQLSTPSCATGAKEPERLPMIHEIKCHPQPYQALEDLIKTFEWRLNDRGFEVGDILHIHEWDPDSGEEGQYTGRSLKRRVTYMLRGGKFGVPKKYVVMSLSPVQE